MPVAHAFIDFETRSAINVKDTGPDRYAEHWSTVVLCMAWAIDDGPVEIWTPADDLPSFVVCPEGVAIHAHNAAFERAIWTRCLGWPDVPLERWYCTAARCAALSLPRSLDHASQALGLSERKDNAGHRVMMQLTKPRRPSKTNPSPWFDDVERFESLYRYCVQDVVTERAIHQTTPGLVGRERAAWLLDQRINDRGIAIDVNACRDIVDQLAEYRQRTEDELRAITGGVGSRQVTKLLGWLQTRGVNVGDLRKESVEAALKRDDLPADARRALEIRADLGRSAVAKYESMIAGVNNDGRARGIHLYYGASTGRWAGRRIQTQNIPRDSILPKSCPNPDAWLADAIAKLRRGRSPDPTRDATALIRSMIIAEPGKRLVVVDFSQIEARVLAWLAGEHHLIEDFEAGRDVYVTQAAKIFGVSESMVDGEKRQIGKAAVLGLGYGMGASRFFDWCELLGISIDVGFAQDVVDKYRETNPAIRRLWWRLGDMMAAVVQHGTPKRLDRLGFTFDDDWFRIWLPSGRPICYYKPQADPVPGRGNPDLSYMSTDSYTRQWTRQRTYGAKLAENVVQAVARDFLASAMQRLEDEGYPVVMHVHDEAVVEVDRRRAVLNDVLRIITTVPRWGNGCPIAADGFVGKRYRK